MRRVALTVSTLTLAATSFGCASTAIATPRPSPSASTSPSTSLSTTPSPSPTPTLPRIEQALAPEQSVGGPRLARMNTVIVDAPAGVPAPPEVADVAWLIADADTGDILAAKNPHAHLLPASTLKTLTAIHLLPRIVPTTVLTATATEANAEGTRVGMVPGQTYTAAQLFQALVMSSGNDAAYGLAALNGGLERTVSELNLLAADLGAHDTVVVDPSGLDAPGQRSSAYDLALFGRAALALPDYVTLATTKTATFPSRPDAATGVRGSFVIGNHNRLIWNYPGAIGVKNGFTKAAHRTFIGAATRGDRTYLVTEMYATGSSWRPAASLLDWAFAHGESVSPIGRLVDRGEVPTPPSPAVVEEGDAPRSSDAAGARQGATAAVTSAGPVTALAPAVITLSAGGALLGLVVLARHRRRAARHRPTQGGRHRHLP